MYILADTEGLHSCYSSATGVFHLKGITSRRAWRLSSLAALLPWFFQQLASCMVSSAFVFSQRAFYSVSVLLARWTLP